MSSLIHRINDNTQAVIDGKLSLVETIEEKGGTVGNYATVPTFASLSRGINSISTINDIVGATDILALAIGDIPKGTVCSLTDVQGGFEAVETMAFPTTARQGSSTVSLTGDVIKLDNEGKVIIRQSVTTIAISGRTTYQYYVFRLVNGVYQQMKYEGSYVYIGGTSKFTYQCSSTYDQATNNLIWTTTQEVYVMHLDFDSLNISLLYTPTDGTVQTGSLGSLRCYGCHFAHNNNFLINAYNTYDYYYMYKYNPDTNTLTFIGELSTLLGIGSSSYSTLIIDATFIGNDLYMCVWSKYGTTNKYASVYVAKFIYDNGTGQYAYQSKVKISSSCVTSSVETKLHMSLGASLVMFQHYNTSQLYAHTVDPVAMTTAEMPLTFSDGLDKTMINGFAMVRGTNFLYVLSTDTTSYSNDELLRLYEYVPGTGVYNFVCCPAVSFSPVAAAGALPQYRNLIDGAYTPIKKSDGTYSMYRVGYASADYDKKAEPCDNTLVENATGYGIATEDIANGETGKVVAILEA